MKQVLEPRIARGVLTPLQGLALRAGQTQGGARSSLCPGLACFGPLALNTRVSWRVNSLTEKGRAAFQDICACSSKS